MRQPFLLQENANLEPHTCLHLTDNWIELAVRFVCPTDGIREIKDRLSRNVLYGRIKVESAEAVEHGHRDGDREGEPAPH